MRLLLNDSRISSDVRQETSVRNMDLKASDRVAKPIKSLKS